MTVYKTAFTTSLVSYAVFALAEYVRPGFVSVHVSLHWFLLASLVFGVLWVWKEPERSSRGFRSWTVLAGLSVVLFVFFWREGAVFGDFRLLLAAIAASLPWVISSDYASET